jgi:hypothetical protein
MYLDHRHRLRTLLDLREKKRNGHEKKNNKRNDQRTRKRKTKRTNGRTTINRKKDKNTKFLPLFSVVAEPQVLSQRWAVAGIETEKTRVSTN